MTATADPRIAVLDTAITAEDAQKARYRREKVARRRFYEERERRTREAPTRTACALCPWEFNGTAEAGVRAARAHRRAEHPERPVRSRKSRNRGMPATSASAQKRDQNRRQQNREAVLHAVQQLKDTWASISEVAEAAGLTPHEAGRHLRAEGYKRVRYRQGRTQFWLGTGEPPTPRRVCALDGCEIAFTPRSNIQKYCSVSCRERHHRAR